jgi:hypothetical protein
VAFNQMCITDVMDHCVAEGNRIYKGTPHEDTWRLYHDKLGQWWEEGAQAYLAQVHQMRHRQWHAEGATNDLIVKRYQNSLTGDQPECQPLDNTYFGDLKEWMGKMVVMTQLLKDDDENKYTMRTPNQCWRTMCHVWDSDSMMSSERIVKCINHNLPKAYAAIVKADGAYVPDCDLRNGHRATTQSAVIKYNKLDAEAREALDAMALTWKGCS